LSLTDSEYEKLRDKALKTGWLARVFSITRAQSLSVMSVEATSGQRAFIAQGTAPFGRRQEVMVWL
tara:strand:- start:270 stop:467 length:198 start_codon:yes stop_codon:yes gene_type:complete